MKTVDLLVQLRPKQDTEYRLEITLTRPNDAGPVTLVGGDVAAMQIDWTAARALAIDRDSDAYGRWLGDVLLFPAGPAREALQQAVAIAYDRDVPLRLRLDLNGAPHTLPWEMMRVAGIGALATGERILLSRFLPSADLRPAVRPRPDRLQLAVSVASPAGLAARDLHVPDETRIRADLVAAVGQELLPPAAATLSGIGGVLRSGCDVFCLAAHGAFAPSGRPFLLLENDRGAVATVAAERMVTEFAALHTVPRLVVLLSCQSAGNNVEAPGNDPLLSLGAQLVTAGVPAVVAMQGNVSQATGAAFLQRFFVEVQRDGCIDRAHAVARRAIAERPDYWAPVLFMRLADGQLWPAASFAAEPAAALEPAAAAPEPILLRIRRVLLRCGPFGSDAEVRTVLQLEPQLRLWQYDLPGAASPAGRVDSLIAYLLDRRRADTGENGLVLFLTALSRRTAAGDLCKDQLDQVAAALRRELSAK